MRIAIVMFALGVWLLQTQAELPDMHVAWLLLLIVPVLALVCAPSRWLRWPGKAVMVLLAFVAGFFWAAGAAHVRLADAVPPHWEGRDIELVGVVASLP